MDLMLCAYHSLKILCSHRLPIGINIWQRSGKQASMGFVMVDYHSKTAGSYQDGLSTIDQSVAISVWQMVVDLLADEWNVFMADIFNEPHDVSNSEWAQWIDYCEDASSAIW